ncbi:MAG: ABC transporter permease [Eubacteriales bacterium]|nr:ABC transporter permease [Eubacteriales bacterium]MDD4540739.1 ABC transporter permease [Eubacteriales bacterium]
MKAFATSLVIQFRGDLRNKGILMVYYFVPIIFYLVMSSIFSLPGFESEQNLIMAMTVFAISMSAFLGLPQSLVQARESGVLNAYRVAGIPSWSLPLSTIVISFVHILIVALIILISAPYLFQAAWPDSIPLHLFFVAVVALASESLGTLLASFVRKQASLALVGQFLFLPTILLSGIMFPRNLLPKPFQYLGEVLPATQAMKLISNGNFQLTPLLILIAITVSAFAVSVIRFRRISLRA